MTSRNRTITADLPSVANLVNGWHKLGQTSASSILGDIRRKENWNLGTKAEILERFAANSVPLLHKTMSLLELKEEACTILEEWMKETPPLSPKMLQFPDCWPLDDIAPSMAPGATREWAMRLLCDRAWGKIAFPERTRAALQRYCHPDQPAPPASRPTHRMRPKLSQSTTQAKQGGGNRPLSSGNTPSLTDRIVEWYETARRNLRFNGGVSGGVHLDATLPNLRNLLDAEPKTGLSGLRGIAIARRKQLDPEKVERHFEAGGQRAEASYYAKVLRELYGEIVGLRDARVDSKPTGEINRKQINALGFPAGPSPQETRNAVAAWGRFHMGTWGRGDLARAALRSATAAYVGDTVETNREPRNLRTEQGSQPSVRLSPTHETDSAERARRSVTETTIGLRQARRPPFPGPPPRPPIPRAPPPRPLPTGSEAAPVVCATTPRTEDSNGKPRLAFSSRPFGDFGCYFCEFGCFFCEL